MQIHRILLSILFGCGVLASAAEWRPVDPAELALKSPKIQKDADAEAIFWDVRVDDQGHAADSRTHYLRVKIFNERGGQTQGRKDIPTLPWVSISDVSGRTIQPDGKIIELKKDAIFERTVVKGGGIKVKTTSFVMPGVVPGSILEYRWRETQNNVFSLLVRRLTVQLDIPVWLVQYHLKPLPSELGGSLSLKIRRFNCPEGPFVRDPDGFHSLSLTNIPAFRPEPQMPPEGQVRGWMLAYYSTNNESPEKIWRDWARENYQQYRNGLKITNEIRKTALEIVAEAPTPREQVDRLDRFCRSKVKNVEYDSSGLTGEERAKAKENKSPADTLKRGLGTGSDINLLFAALATAAGFEVRPARVANRSDIFFDRRLAPPFFLNASNVAVRVGTKWSFFDPATPYLAPGMLRWQEEGQEVLIGDDEPQWASTPLAGPEQSCTTRRGVFRLTADGVLDGDVTIQHTGHTGVVEKRFYDVHSAPEREEHLRELVKQRLGTAELRDIKFDNITDHEKPIIQSYHVRVPGYGQRAGRRLFVRPAFFQHGIESLFAASERKHPIYFHYPWSEQDEVAIELPPGFSLDNAESPGSSQLAQVGAYSVKLSYAAQERKLLYTRSFRWGLESMILFPAAAYHNLKSLFDFVHMQDNHTIALKQEADGRSEP